MTLVDVTTEESERENNTVELYPGKPVTNTSLNTDTPVFTGDMVVLHINE